MSIIERLKQKKDRVKTADVPLEQAEDKAQSASAPAAPRSASAFLLKRAWITEKAASLVKDRKYIFLIDSSANKSEVKKIVEASYGVKVNDVNIVSRKGKSKRLGRSVGRTPNFKKAVVTLREGHKIEALTP